MNFFRLTSRGYVIYISLLGGLLEKRLKLSQLFNVCLVVLGAAVIKWGSVSDNFFLGFLLVQGANLSFGLGQVLYKKYCVDKDQKEIFSLFYLGALIPVIFLVLMYSEINLSSTSGLRWGVLLWLGVISSGPCYYLWNSGAKLITYGQLAVMNNAVIPLAIIVNVLFWGKEAEFVTFFSGTGIIAIGVLLESKRVR